MTYIDDASNEKYEKFWWRWAFLNIW